MLQDLLGDRKTINTVFAYLFGSIGKYQYRNLIGDRQRAKDVWVSVMDNGYLLKNCKLYAYAYAVNKKLGLPTSPAKFGIHREDVNFLQKLDLTHIKDGYKPYSVFDFDNLEGALLSSPEMKAYIGRFISKKLVFLCRSYGKTRDEIEGKLLCDAIFALRKHYPRYETQLHALNICKTAIHNSGIGLIEFHTRAKRNALMHDGTAFQAVHVDLSILNNIGVEPAHEDETYMHMKSISSLSTKMCDTDRSFLLAASGEYDAGFSFYIGKDNRDLIEHADYTRYLSLLGGYHKMTEAYQANLLNNLRIALS